MAPRSNRGSPSIAGFVTIGVAVASAVGLVRERLRSMDLQDVLEATEYEVRFLRERAQELSQDNERLKKRIEELESPDAGPADGEAKRPRRSRAASEDAKST